MVREAGLAIEYFIEAKALQYSSTVVNSCECISDVKGVVLVSICNTGACCSQFDLKYVNSVCACMAMQMNFVCVVFPLSI